MEGEEGEGEGEEGEDVEEDKQDMHRTQSKCVCVSVCAYIHVWSEHT